MKLVSQRRSSTISREVVFWVDFGDRIRAARKAAGWSQRRLADALGVTQSGVARMEAGQQPVGAYALSVLCREFGVRPGRLLGLDR